MRRKRERPSRSSPLDELMPRTLSKSTAELLERQNFQYQLVGKDMLLLFL